jgi:hypothetical protein
LAGHGWTVAVAVAVAVAVGVGVGVEVEVEVEVGVEVGVEVEVSLHLEKAATRAVQRSLPTKQRTLKRMGPVSVISLQECATGLGG